VCVNVDPFSKPMSFKVRFVSSFVGMLID